MKRWFAFTVAGCLMCSLGSGDAAGRGFGGARGFGGGGYGGFGGSRSFSGYDRGGFGGSYGGSRSFSGYSGWNRGGATGSYDRSYSGARGGSISTEGTRGAVYGPRGAAAGGTRDTTVTGPEGRSYSGSSERGAAVGPYGRTVGGAEHTGTATGPRGTATRSWESAYAGHASDFGLAHYSSVGVAGVHGTAYWSHGYVAGRAGYVRGGFGYYNCFHPAWYAAHPGCWYAAGWAAATAWVPATWAAVSSYCAIPAAPIDYDYGNSVVYQNNNVYVDGQDVGTAQAYAQQATTLADQGQKANAPPEQDWKPLGVFALVQGEEKTSNNIFQLAINKDGIIRGNFYEGVMDQTTPVYGSVDKKTQRAAWTIGKKNDRVFETGLENLTKSETAVLVHLGTQQTQQWLLVRVEQPKQ